MNNSDLYLRNNDVQRRDSSDLLDEFSHYFKWRYDRFDNLLDIGCGPGDVLFDFTLQKIPENFHKIVGIDISNEMLNYARENFGNEFIEFHRVDISEISAFQRLDNQQFDNITSFYCLHWIQNQKQVFANIQKLLSKDGTAIIAFLTYTPLFDIYERLSRMNKYKQFMSDVKNFISPYHYEKRPLDVVKSYCNENGLIVKHIELREKTFYYQNYSHLKDAVESINPFTKRMPKKLAKYFINDYVKLVKEITENRFNNDEKIISRYKLLIAVLTK
ncbi:hypothetical protein PVAND_004632 [Polypedilum vanderplanki]|uniref:Methyltransferase domain-containing protein n=1 Tax=Polypedilum vanderplanki TaxID=319348 RepID=A0A9J6BYB0_POLVA|nr:hypothetical protein PVAND_004632 [Polypedilum vanderplanki]